MKKSILILMIMAMQIGTQESRANDLLGLYLDQEYIENCRPEITNFPYYFTTYLVIHDNSSENGIGGWECSISSTDSILFINDEIINEGVNFGTETDYMVDLAEQLPGGSNNLLARIDYVALGPGKIYINAASKCSSSNPLLPCYVDGNDYDNIIDLYYAYGSPELPVLTIGLTECPNDSLIPEDYIPQPPDWDYVDIQLLTSGEDCEISGSSDESKALPTSIDWMEWAKSDMAIIGRISSLDTVAVIKNRYKVGMLRIQTEDNNILWGENYYKLQLPIYCMQVSIPGFLKYVNQQYAIDFKIGDTVILKANYDKGYFATTVQGIRPLRLLDEKNNILPPVDLKTGIARIKSKSDIIIIGKTVRTIPNLSPDDCGYEHSLVKIKSLLYGNFQTNEIRIDETSYFLRELELKYPEDDFVLFLSKVDDSTYEIVEQNSGIYRVGKEGLINRDNITLTFQPLR